MARAGAYAIVLALAGIAALVVVNGLFPFPDRPLSGPGAAVVTDARGQRLRVFLPPDQMRREPTALKDVSPLLARAVVASEDKRFFSHPGVDPLAVARAAWSNLKAGRVVSGASTIPMQTARLAHPRPRTLGAKAVEAFRALQLSRAFSKNEILHLYLNMLPYGGNVVGVGAAARHYFGRPPSDLSPAQCALLAVIPRSPARLDPFAAPGPAKAARDRLLDDLARQDIFSPREAARAKAEPLPTAPTPNPMLAPHFSRLAHAENPGRALVRTTLDARVQRVCDRLAKARAASMAQEGLRGLAVVVLDNADRSVLAMIGSPDFFAPDSGQVNMALARRSPGSTLKPFLYAWAMDQGEIVPESFVLDVPTQYAGYSPENYDGTYKGKVTVAQALAGSLNVPAVRLLAQAGPRRFYEFMRAILPEALDKQFAHYGLPLALGACEVNLLELANLYATLASGGEHLQPRLLADAPPGERLRILSPEACALTTEILVAVRRPDMPEAWRLTADAPEIAWKTGTSFGHRDAWAIGYTGRHTVGVWVGNPDGEPRQGISGATHAGPLLFDVLRAIEPGAASPPAFPQARIAWAEVCPQDHLLPTPLCPGSERIRVLPGVTRLKRSQAFVRILVDRDTGMRLAGDCLEGRQARTLVLPRLEPEYAAWLASMGQNPPGLPAMHPACADAAQEKLRILSPDPRTPYHIRAHAPRDFQGIALSAAAQPGSKQLYWFQDGQLLAATRPGKTAFAAPVPGTHHLAVTDQAGRTATLQYEVRPADAP